MSKSDDIKRNSNKIWLAGLGAYAMIEESGQDHFEALVSKGQEFEKANQSKQEDPQADSALDELKVKANQTMDRIERAFDMRVSSALGRLGISRKSDLDNLNQKIDQLTAALEKVNATTKSARILSAPVDSLPNWPQESRVSWPSPAPAFRRKTGEKFR